MKTPVADVRVDVFFPGGKIAELHRKGRQVGKIFINPFMPEMQYSNRIVLVINENEEIIGGSLGCYNYKKGLHVVEF